MLSWFLVLASTCGDHLEQKDCTPAAGTDVVGLVLYIAAAIAAVAFVGFWLYQRRDR